MSERTNDKVLSKGSICEQIVYTPCLGAYPNSSDMTELSEIGGVWPWW